MPENEVDLIEKAREHRAKIAAEKAALGAVLGERKKVLRAIERERLAKSREALAEAEKVHDEKQAALKAAEAELRRIEEAWASGGESLTVDDAEKARLAVKRAAGIFESKKAPVHKARAAVAIDSSDNLLADAVVELFTEHAKPLGIDGFDIVAFKRAGEYDAPLRPALLVSQTAPTGNYGRALVNGSVRLHWAMPEGQEAPVLDAERVADVLGPGGTLAGDVLTLRRWSTPTPQLIAPDREFLFGWGWDVERQIIENARSRSKAFGGPSLELSDAEPTRIEVDMRVDGVAVVGKVALTFALKPGASSAVLWNAARAVSGYMVDHVTDIGTIESVKILGDHAAPLPPSLTGTGNFSIYGPEIMKDANEGKYRVEYEIHASYVPLVEETDVSESEAA